MGAKRCVCGKVITNSYDLCNSCLEEYGADSGNWPEWLVFMVADLKRERRQDRITRDREVTFSELGIEQLHFS
jgi:hypothetical protein